MQEINKTKNRWTEVTASDYEGHMDSPHVGQLKFLNKLLKDVLEEYKPASLAIPGCTTGNGFEHIDFEITKNVLAVDINSEYIKILREKFSDNLDKIESVCSDIDSFDFAQRKFDLVHCALIFEYVNVPALVNKIFNALNKNGRLTVLLQLPHESASPVSKTDFDSIKNLIGFVNLVPPAEFNEIAVNAGFNKESEKIYKLESGKEFWFGILRKN
ncbi:MAG TPA: class I SAM-dependent methyltransferase [Ignavibacteriaceae bacterium]|nr:class I SAM-dependent methyltransferase [Ignavibacteriaceae bacterium]